MTISEYSLQVPAADAEIVIEFHLSCGKKFTEVRYEGDTVDLRSQVPVHYPPYTNMAALRARSAS